MMPESRARPAVSVIVPFAGDRAAALAALERLGRLRLEPGDELIVVDNGDGVARAAARGGTVAVIDASEERSAYYARNRGAEGARNDWLLFLDADCRPAERLLDLYFAEPIADRVGVIGGRIATGEGAETAAARWAVARANVDQLRNLDESGGAVASGNMLVRREAWLAAGGFLEGIRSGGDLDFCWRVSERGWRVCYRAGPVVEHPPQRTLAALAAQISRWAAGNAWQERRRPGSSPRPALLRPLAASLRRAASATIAGRRDAAQVAAVDAVVVGVRAAGRLGDNAAMRTSPQGEGRPVVCFTDTFAARSETFITGEARALARRGWLVRFEAAARPELPALGASREWSVSYLEDEGRVTRARALAWLLTRHPLRCARDVIERRHLPRSELLPLRSLAPAARRLARAADVHVHAHFAGPAATHALRVARLGRRPVSVVAHAHEVYARPTGLAAKLAAADLVIATSEYVRADLRALLDPGSRDKVEVIVMGVDPDRFRRGAPPPGGRTVAAVGRYVEKKGFRHLIEAAAILRERGAETRVRIAGDGPLRGELERLARDRGVADLVELCGAPGPEAVRELLERADLLAMPSVIAADGDRDSMPVVVKEAMAMELPVVGSDEVGIPEMIEPGWGRLVAPGDPVALADAIAELLALSGSERAAMGRAGREYVLARAHVGREAGRLEALIDAQSIGER